MGKAEENHGKTMGKHVLFISFTLCSFGNGGLKHQKMMLMHELKLRIGASNMSISSSHKSMLEMAL